MAQVCLPAMMLRAVMNARDDSGSSGSGSSGTDSDSERVRRRNLGQQLLHPDDDVSPSSTQPSPPQFWRFGGDIPGVGPFDTLAVPPASGVQNAAGDAQVQAVAAPKKKRKRKYRKGTHTIRKEEIASLHQEIVELRRHLEALKSASLPANANGEPESEQDREFREKIFSNRLLRRALRQQQSKFAPVHALMTNYTLWEAEGGCELHQFLHLESDEHLRQTALTAMKTHAINRGKQFLQRRWPHVDPWRPMKQEHFFESSRGDYMGVSKATMPFRKITSVKTAFDAVLSFFNNLEISASEQFGSITIREDNDSADSGVAQNRLVTTAPSGLRMESNTIFFSCYYDVDSGWGDQPEHGIVVCNFVDHDERYPYLTDERIRRDVSAVVEVKCHAMKDHETGEMKTAVVLTRWVQTKLHLPTFKVEPDDWEALCEKMERWVHILQPKLLEGLV